MKVRVTITKEFDILDFFSQYEIDESERLNMPMDFEYFKEVLTDYFYDEPMDIIQDLKFEEVKE